MKKNLLIKFSIIFIFIYILSLTGCSSAPIVAPKEKVLKNVAVNFYDAMTVQAEVDKNLKKEVASGYKFDNPFIVLNPYGNAPLSALVIFKTYNETSVKLRVVGHDSSVDIFHDFPNAKNHIIPVYGLYPNEENTVELTLGDGTKKVLKIKTDVCNSPLVKATVVTAADNKYVADGLTFATPQTIRANKISIVAYDLNGDLRWFLTSAINSGPIGRSKNGRIFIISDRKLAIREIDLMGKNYNEYFVDIHHDIRELPNGNYLTCSGEKVVEIDRETGDVLKTFFVDKLVPSEDGSSLMAKPDDLLHLNAAWYDTENNTVMISVRHQNAIYGVDYDSGKLKWIIGDPDGWTKVDKKYFFTPIGINFEWQFAQHCVTKTPEGYIFFFDNGNYRAKKSNLQNALTADQNYSRAVMYKIDENNMTIRQVWSYGKERGANWYSDKISGVEYLAPNHFIIDSGALTYDSANKTHIIGNGIDAEMTASMVEIRNDKVIFELKVNINCYRAIRMDPYFNGDNFDLNTTGKTIGKLPEQKFIDVNIPSATPIPPDFFQLNVFQDYDMLYVKGIWDAGKTAKDTNIILRPVSEGKPLVVQFKPEKGEIKPDKPISYSTTISLTGIKGIFDILILADGVLYDPVLRLDVKD